MLIYVDFNKNKKLNVIEKVGLAKGCSIVSTSRVHCFSISQSSLCWIWFVLPEFFIHHCQYHTCLNVHDLYSLASKSSVLSLRFAVLTVTKEDNLLQEISATDQNPCQTSAHRSASKCPVETDGWKQVAASGLASCPSTFLLTLCQCPVPHHPWACNQISLDGVRQFSHLFDVSGASSASIVALHSVFSV